ncbi:DinB family protein [[Bacillus] enclensis]|uniref:DinB family protein n=1 Tax=[Bacillus] enclensis TaxID=1402860 RepID=UPI003AF8DD82
MESTKESLYFIQGIEGYDPQLGKLVSMMNYARHTLLESVENLTVEELDFHMDEKSNSIGMLLYHIGSLEKAFQIMTFEDRDLTDDEWEDLSLGIVLGGDAKGKIKGHSLDYYVDRLSEIRALTLTTFSTLQDSWLDNVNPYGWDYPANNYFKWFHVFEDELNHRGQIRMIAKRL